LFHGAHGQSEEIHEAAANPVLDGAPIRRRQDSQFPIRLKLRARPGSHLLSGLVLAQLQGEYRWMATHHRAASFRIRVRSTVQPKQIVGQSRECEVSLWQSRD